MAAPTSQKHRRRGKALAVIVGERKEERSPEDDVMDTPRMARITRSWLPMALLLMTPVAAAQTPAQPDASRGAREDEPLPVQEQGQVAEQEGAVYGRLRLVQGAVSLKRNNEISTDLVINDPLTPGD